MKIKYYKATRKDIIKSLFNEPFYIWIKTFDYIKWAEEGKLSYKGIPVKLI